MLKWKNVVSCEKLILQIFVVHNGSYMCQCYRIPPLFPQLNVMSSQADSVTESGLYHLTEPAFIRLPPVFDRRKKNG